MSTPYVLAAGDYLDAGWSPIPFPYKEKSPPGDNLTGVEGEYVTSKMVKAWTRKLKPLRVKAGNLSFAAGNIALRLPATVIGIDVDRYGGKAGARTMEEATKKWGPLPATWVSTSRDDGSGIMFFRIPEGLSWPGQVGPGVETLRWDHRYAMVAPSIHPEGRMYAWVHPDGRKVDDEFPSPEELPALPKEWVEGLTNGKKWQQRDVEDLTQQEVRDWLDARSTETCDAMRKSLVSAQRRVRLAGDDGGAHEAARDGAWALIGDAGAGHGGVVAALAALRKTFLEGVKERRSKGSAEGEWARAVVRGVQKVAAEGTPEETDICHLLGSGAGSSTTTELSSSSGDDPSQEKRTGSSGSSAFDYTRDDIGNAQRLVTRVGTDARYVPALGGWAVFDGASGLWSVDPSGGPIYREAFQMVRELEREAEFIEDPKAQSAFMAFVRASGNLGKIEAMVKLAGRLRNVEASADLFDADPAVLHCSNGVVELGERGVSFRGHRHSDFATHTTGTEFKQGARNTDWDAFLDRVLPDTADRAWVQTLAGYSLFGANPDRIMVIAKGPTTSGKTTFAEALKAALGGYASAFNLTMLREKQDEGARADIVDALPKRFLVASEASSDWFLHADLIKRITGGEELVARRLNSNTYVKRMPAFTPWLTTNSYPQIPGADKALWRRLKAAPFLVSIPEDETDPFLRGRLSTPEARTAILAWAVEGWERYAEHGLREMSPAAAGLELEAREEMSDLDACLAQTCDFAAEYTEASMALYEVYRSWTAVHADERRMLTLTAWGRLMSAKGFAKEKARVEPGSDVKRVVRTGLRLNREWSKIGGS